MAARTPIRERRDPCRFLSALSSAFFEWLLIILLFIDALFSYVVTKFAHYCKLPTPCLLCSRLDGILRNEKPGFYKELICNAHKLEMSLLAYCHSHQRLADAREMCDGCLLSFVGKMDLDDGLNGDFLRKKFCGEDMIKIPLLKSDLEPGSLSTRHCSCCSVPFRNRPLAYRLIQSKPPTGADIAECDISLLGSRLRDGLAKGMENSSRSLTIYHAGDHGFDRLSHIGYSELKITSDSESEVPFSDDDDAGALARGTDNLKEEFMSRSLQPAPMAIIPKNLTQVFSDDLVLEKLIHPSTIMPEASLLVPERKLQVGDSNSIVGTGHGLDEINSSRVEVRPNPTISSEITFEQVPAEVLITKDVPEIGHVASNGEAIKAFSSTDISSKMSQITNEKLTAGIKGPLPSPASSELVTGRESSRVSEDLKLRLSQISAARWLEFPWNDMTPSPRVNGQGDESKLSDASSSTGFHIHAKRFSVDRYESGLESLDGSLVSDIEGESAVDRLKRQTEMDRKSMSILYKELEEERNASAISANQAMAMINRLQEEKAAMQMEALQYLRMMEEQTEYDQEALQKLNDLLGDRDKEIQDLESEVDSYRKQFGGEQLTGRVLEPSFDSEEREYTPVSTPRFMRSRGRQTGSTLVKNTVLDFEDEKVYISECLKRLERKLQLFSYSGVYAVGSRLDVEEDDLPDKNSLLEHNATRNGEYPKEAVGDNDQERPQWDNVTQENSQRCGMIMSEDSSPSREESHVKASSTPFLTHGVQLSIKEAFKESRLRSISYNERQFQMVNRSDIIALGNEVSRLNARLEALEADRNFLEHAVHSLRNESNGLQFIQEIACHLRELRKIGITHQEHTVP